MADQKACSASSSPGTKASNVARVRWGPSLVSKTHDRDYYATLDGLPVGHIRGLMSKALAKRKRS